MDIVLGLLTGGATGLIGTALSGVMKFFNMKQEQAHELKVMEMELRQMDKEAEIALSIEEKKQEGKEAEAAWRGLEASYREAGQRWSTGDSGWIVFVDVVRGLMRPLLTLLLVVLMGVIYFTLGADKPSMQDQIIATVLYLATASVLWWFGSRMLDNKKK
jgi:hypothetical protein